MFFSEDNALLSQIAGPAAGIFLTLLGGEGQAVKDLAWSQRDQDELVDEKTGWPEDLTTLVYATTYNESLSLFSPMTKALMKLGSHGDGAVPLWDQITGFRGASTARCRRTT